MLRKILLPDMISLPKALRRYSNNKVTGIHKGHLHHRGRKRLMKVRTKVGRVKKGVWLLLGILYKAVSFREERAFNGHCTILLPR